MCCYKLNPLDQALIASVVRRACSRVRGLLTRAPQLVQIREDNMLLPWVAGLRKLHTCQLRSSYNTRLDALKNKRLSGRLAERMFQSRM